MAKAKTKSPATPTAKTHAKPFNANHHSEGTVEVAMAVTKKVNGLALKFDDALAAGKTKVSDGLQLITAAISMRDLSPIQLREVFDYSAGLVDAVAEAKSLSRGRVLELAERIGEKTGTGNNSLRLNFEDGKTLLCKAQKSGTDPKKFEAALRAKGKDVATYMAQTISYKLSNDYDSVQKAVDDGIFTKDEAALLDYDVSYAVERSKEGKVE